MRRKQTGRLPRAAILHRTKKKSSTEEGQNEMMELLKNVDMDAMREAMQSRETQRKLKNFKI
jgi:hypothetical protein